MKIIFLSHKMPYPPNKGEKIRAFNIIKHLSKYHEIYLVSLYDDKKDSEYIYELGKYCKKVYSFYLNPVVAATNGLFSIFLHKPITLGYFYSRKLKARVDELIDSENFDLIFVSSSSMAQYVDSVNAKKIIDFVDCDSAKWKKYAEFSKFPMSWIFDREHRLLREYEKTIAANSDRSIITTQKEKDEFANFLNTDKFSVIANGVDANFFKIKNQSHDRRLIFTGMMDYFANVDGMVYFCDDILPLIKTGIPDVELYIVGNKPTMSIRNLAKIKGVFVTGFVNDIRKYLEMATVAVVPLRITQGIQNKILEAMASGLAVVSTSKAAAGLEAKNDIDLFLADTPEEFSKTVVMLLKDEGLRKKAGSSARQYVEKNHNWDVNLSPLDDILTSIVRPHR